MNDAEELQPELVAPRFVGRVGESTEAPLPRIVDENVEAAEPPLDRAAKGLDRGLVEHVATLGESRVAKNAAAGSATP